MKLKIVFVVGFSLFAPLLNAQIQTQPARTQTDQPLNKTFIFKSKVQLKQERVLTILPGTCRIEGYYKATQPFITEKAYGYAGRLGFINHVDTEEWPIHAYCGTNLPDKAIVKKIAAQGFLKSQNGTMDITFNKVLRENMSKKPDSWAGVKAFETVANVKFGQYSNDRNYPQTYHTVTLNHTVELQKYAYLLQVDLYKKANLRSDEIFLSAIDITYDEIQ